MLEEHWPLFGLRVRTPRLEIRLPTDDDLAVLLEVVREGIHDPVTMPFLKPWTDIRSPDLERNALQWWWGRRAAWSPEDWSFTGAVFVDGRAIGVQDVAGRSFASLRAVTTGSWLGRRYQGQGLGREMRTAILHLAFEGLGAVEAYSGAWSDNTRSRRVSSSLGYREAVGRLALRRGEPDRLIDFVIDRDAWSLHRRDDILIEGLEPCLPMFGIDPAAPA